MRDEAPVVVTLSDMELWKLERIATWRNDPKMETVPNRKICDDDDYQLHRIGVFGEYAVSIYFREPMDVFIDLGGDDNITDLVIANLSVSVKCSAHANPNLIFRELSKFRQHVAILTSFEEPNRVLLHGWITPSRFAAICKPRNFGFGDHLAVAASELWHVDSLKAIAYDRWRCCQLSGKLMQGALEGA